MSRTLDERLAALAEAAELAAGRLDPGPVEAARAVVGRAGARLGLGVEATVVALAGPTGAGKSTLFNALAGAELVRAGHRRPTTSTATAATWGEVPEPLLDWLDVRLRHPVAGDRHDGLVVVDLPDFDSVERAHRLEADRIIALVDLLAWVVDPQKYADATLHDDHLAPLAAHGDAMLVVLNQADTLTPDAREACRADLRRLLAANGLDAVPVLAVSARTGEGLDLLDGLLADRVARREAAVARLAADVETAAAALAGGCGEGRAAGVGRGERQRLVLALAGAAAVPSVVRAVDRSHRRAGALATGWPVLRWALRLRPDPLKRLRVSGDEATRTSLPSATPVQRAEVSSAIRSLAASAAAGLPDPWPGLARSAAASREPELADRLDRAVAGAELESRRPRWWTVAGALQRVLAAVAAVGAVWLLALAALGYLQLEDVVPTPEVSGFPLPTLLLGGGLLGGLVLAALARIVNGAGARRRSRRAARLLHGRVEAVAAELVLDPLAAELAARERLCRAVAAAR